MFSKEAALHVLFFVLGSVALIYSVYNWAVAEWSILEVLFELKGKLTFDLSTGFSAFMAISAYWIGFIFLVVATYYFFGQRGSFITWAVIGSFFEIITFILVVMRGGKIKNLFQDSTAMGLLLLTAVCIVLIGYSADQLRTRLDIGT